MLWKDKLKILIKCNKLIFGTKPQTCENQRLGSIKVFPTDPDHLPTDPHFFPKQENYQ